MPTYLYLCKESHGEFEVDHSMSEKLELCPKCKEDGKESPVTRLISGGTGFQLKAGGVGWADSGYGK